MDIPKLLIIVYIFVGALSPTISSQDIKHSYDTGFKPEVHGWGFPNENKYFSRIDKPSKAFNEDGICLGMVIGAKAHFLAGTKNLYEASRIRPVPDPFVNFTNKYQALWLQDKFEGGFKSVSGHLIKKMMSVKCEPIPIAVNFEDGGSHALLAYKYNNKKLYYYDPNIPFYSSAYPEKGLYIQIDKKGRPDWDNSVIAAETVEPQFSFQGNLWLFDKQIKMAGLWDNYIRSTINTAKRHQSNKKYSDLNLTRRKDSQSFMSDCIERLIFSGRLPLKIDKAIDGDSILIKYKWNGAWKKYDQEIRLKGVDAPELYSTKGTTGNSSVSKQKDKKVIPYLEDKKTSPSDDKLNRRAIAARNYLKQFKGWTVSFKSTPGRVRDDDERPLVHAEVQKDGKSVYLNKSLVEEGHAWPYLQPYYKKNCWPGLSYKEPHWKDLKENWVNVAPYYQREIVESYEYREHICCVDYKPRNSRTSSECATKTKDTSESGKGFCQNVMVVLDRSGSMEGKKMKRARQAAANFYDFAKGGRVRVGQSIFNKQADLLFPLLPLDGRTVRSRKSTVMSVQADGGTLYNAALSHALNNIYVSSNNLSILFLSDGKSNKDHYRTDVVPALKEQGISVYTLGFGTDADEEALKWIAQRTGGDYLYAGNKGPDLKQAFRRMFGRISGQSELVTLRAFLNDDEQQDSFSFSVPEDISQEWTGNCLDENPKLSLAGLWTGSDLRFVLYSPDGKTYKSTLYGKKKGVTKSVDLRNHLRQVTVDDPQPGTWKAVVRGSDLPDQGEFYTITASMADRIPLHLKYMQFQYKPSDTVTIGVRIPPDKISTKKVTARILPPGNKQRIRRVTLADNGEDGDPVADDNVYSTRLENTNDPGVYSTTVRVRGTTKTSDGKQQYSRTLVGSFIVGNQKQVSDWVRTKKPGPRYGLGVNRVLRVECPLKNLMKQLNK